MTLRNIFSVFIFTLCTFSLFSQFTYIEAGLGYNNITFNKGSGFVYTNHNNMSVRINGTCRVLRNLGIGIELSVPVIQGGKFGFQNAYTPDGSHFFNFQSSSDNRYAPSKYDYSFKESIKASVFGRIFFDTRINSYFDIRFSMFSITENFRFYRPFMHGIYNSYYSSDNRPPLEEVDISFSKKHQQFIPGFAIGMKPHLGEKLFINFNIGLNLLFFDKKNFSYELSHGWNNVHKNSEYVRLESQTGSMRTSLSLNLGFGYYF